jgi:cysteine synthase
VTDPNVNATACAVMRSFGADVVMIDQRDANGGFLGSRVEFIAQQLLADPSLVWLDQYTNPGNSLAHEWGTARALLNSFPSIDYLFVGVGTGGTLAGCLATMRRLSPLTKVVAVDAIGSVTFGQSAAVRRIPGLGSSLGAVMVDRKAPDVVVHVSEADTIHECRWMASQKGILVGGSTGTVLAALRLMTDEISPAATVVAISPDLGDRYLDTIYDDGWILRHGLDRNSQEPATDQDRTRVTYRSERSLDAVI